MTKCELCGTPVKVVGDTTKHYEPINQRCLDLAKEIAEIIIERDDDLDAVLPPLAKEFLEALEIQVGLTESDKK